MTVLAPNLPSYVPAIQMPYGGSLAINKGDLCFYSTNTVVPASSLTDLLSLLANQAAYALLFVGIAAESKTTSDVAGTIGIITDVMDIDIPCTSSAWEIGDDIALAEDVATGTIVQNQLVRKGTVKASRIGYCSQRQGSAVTTVRCRLFSRFAPSNVGTQALTIGGSTAAAGSTTSDATALPAGTAKFYPVTAADDTKGVKITVSDQYTGNRLFIGNQVSNKILKIYGPTGAVINGAAADAAFSSVSGAGIDIVCINGPANTWSAK